ncbi:MAG: methylglyoxal reductase (NADPH-dependent) gre2 [Vezdaea aestivalis]|nr:MAG: methylglyoxal reductase (NADPH-dependent) gre2 [Vezdaea aestivalis]
MGRVLLTGGSGFVALHILSILLERGHSVVTTVRSPEKGDKIKTLFSNASKSQLNFVIVKDIAVEGAFDKAVISDPPFDTVIHTASPFRFDVTDVQTQLLDPAVIGTTGILRSIKSLAPSVRRVVITSSFASIIDGSKGDRPGYVYSEKDWNPITLEEALQGPSPGYYGSKTFAEKAAWGFVEKEKPSFDLTTLNPPMVYGPVFPSMQTLKSLNTSNQLIHRIIRGDMKNEIEQTSVPLWVDVRDLALAHVKAFEVPAAGGKRFLATAGIYSNKEMVDTIGDAFASLKDKLPGKETEGGRLPEGGVFSYDNSQIKSILGIQFRSLEECMVSLVQSLQEMGA